MVTRRYSTQPVCITRNCSKTCRENKDHCIDHLEELPHVERVLRDIERMKIDCDLLNKGKQPLYDHYEKEMVLSLGITGPQTAQRLSRTIGLTLKGILYLAKHLKRPIRKTKRGTRIVS